MQELYYSLLEKRIRQLEHAIEAGEKKSAPALNDEDVDSKTSRYRNILRRWDKNIGTHVDEDVDANFFVKPPVKNVAYTFRRIYNPETGEKGAYSELDIEDPGLIALLRAEMVKYPGVNFDSDMISMQAPFAPLVHNWDKLVRRSEHEPESQTTKDLASLLERVRTAPELEDYFKSRESNMAAKVTTFDTLWTVFAPGTHIVARVFRGSEQIFTVHDSPIPWPQYAAQVTYKHHTMWVWNWDYDGKKILKVFYKLKFERFRGTKPITELPYYTLSVLPDERQQALTKASRGRAYKFIKATVRCKKGAEQMFMYHGLAYADQRNLLSNKDDAPTTVFSKSTSSSGLQ